MSVEDDITKTILLSCATRMNPITARHYARNIERAGLAKRVYSEEDVERAANRLLMEQTNGLCQIGKICNPCDCFAVFEPASIVDRDNYARAHVRAVIQALEGDGR